MKENLFIQNYLSHPLLNSLIESAGSDKNQKIRLGGLTSSAKAIVTATVFSKTQTTHLADRKSVV